MSHQAQVQPQTKAPVTNVGKTVLMCGGVVAAGFAGFYSFLVWNKKRQQAAGTNPTFERVMAVAATKPRPGEVLEVIESATFSDYPPARPGNTNYNGHFTNRNWKTGEAYTQEGDALRRMEPTPQRARHDDPTKAYTKGPDFSKSYNKVPLPHAPVRAHAE